MLTAHRAESTLARNILIPPYHLLAGGAVRRPDEFRIRKLLNSALPYTEIREPLQAKLAVSLSVILEIFAAVLDVLRLAKVVMP